MNQKVSEIKGEIRVGGVRGGNLYRGFRRLCFVIVIFVSSHVKISDSFDVKQFFSDWLPAVILNFLNIFIYEKNPLFMTSTSRCVNVDCFDSIVPDFYDITFRLTRTFINKTIPSRENNEQSS